MHNTVDYSMDNAGAGTTGPSIRASGRADKAWVSSSPSIASELPQHRLSHLRLHIFEHGCILQ